MFTFGRKLFNRTGEKPDDPQDQYLEVPPHGQALFLDLVASARKSRGDAISNRLMKFARQATGFVAILIDLGETEYRFSSGDLASVASTIAAFHRGWVAPCAIVRRGSSAAALQGLLDLTKLNELPQLRIVDSKESGLAHIREHLERRGA